MEKLCKYLSLFYYKMRQKWWCLVVECKEILTVIHSKSNFNQDTNLKIDVEFIQSSNDILF